ncbi:hypothetical protein ACP275_14G251600 [Erythranthe tilingii]
MLGEADQTQVRMNLKLLIDTESKRVLFAEAGKDFVDFLFKIQTLPVSTVVVSLLQKKQARVGSLTNLYESIENLKKYMQWNGSKDALLKPAPLSLVATHIHCPKCYRGMTSSMTYVAPSFYERGIGFVKDMVNYMVMDDLVVMPLSTISSIAFLNKLDVKDFSAVREKRVDFGMDEAVKLLSASLHTNNVLTDDVFLNGTTSTSKKGNTHASREN